MDEDTGTPRVLIRGILQRNQPQKTVNTPLSSDGASENIPFNSKTPTDLLRDRRKSLLQRKVTVGKTPRHMIKGFLQTEGIQRPKVAQTPKVKVAEEGEGEESSASLDTLNTGQANQACGRTLTEPINASDLFKSIVAAQSLARRPKDGAYRSSDVESTVSIEKIQVTKTDRIDTEEDQMAAEEAFADDMMSDSYAAGEHIEEVAEVPAEPSATRTEAIAHHTCAYDQPETLILPDRSSTGDNNVKPTRGKLLVESTLSSAHTEEDILESHAGKAAQVPRFPPRTSKKLFSAFLRSCGPVSKGGSSINSALNDVTASFFEQLAGDLSEHARERSSQKQKVSHADMEAFLKQQGHITEETSMEDLIRQLFTREYSDELLDLASR